MVLLSDAIWQGMVDQGVSRPIDFARLRCAVLFRIRHSFGLCGEWQALTEAITKRRSHACAATMAVARDLRHSRARQEMICAVTFPCWIADPLSTFGVFTALAAQSNLPIASSLVGLAVAGCRQGAGRRARKLSSPHFKAKQVVRRDGAGHGADHAGESRTCIPSRCTARTTAPKSFPTAFAALRTGTAPKSRSRRNMRASTSGSTSTASTTRRPSG